MRRNTVFASMVLVLFIQGVSTNARAEVLEGEACSVPKDISGNIAPPDPCEGERFVMASVNVPALPKNVSAKTHDPKCGEGLNTPSVAAVAAGAFAAAYTGRPDLGLMAASLTDRVAGGLVPNSSLFMAHTDKANCAALVAVVPSVAKITGFRLVADSIAAGPSKCAPGSDCPTAWARFMYTPIEATKDSITYVSVDFQNWASYEQTGRLFVWFKMPEGSKAPLVMK